MGKTVLDSAPRAKSRTIFLLAFFIGYLLAVATAGQEPADTDVLVADFLASCKTQRLPMKWVRESTFVLVGTTGECTVPMEVSRYDSQPSAEDEIYVVWEHSHCSSMGGEPSWSRRRSPGLLYGVELKRDSRDDARLHLTDNRYGTIRATGNDLYVPEGWRLIRCEKDDYGPMESSGTDKEEDKKPKPIKLVLGRNVDDLKDITFSEGGPKAWCLPGT